MRNQDPRYPAQEVGAILRGALNRTTGRRHAAEVTSDRLGDAVTQWGEQFTAAELDMVGVIRQRLEAIAGQATSGTRPDPGGDA